MSLGCYVTYLSGHGSGEILWSRYAKTCNLGVFPLEITLLFRAQVSSQCRSSLLLRFSIDLIRSIDPQRSLRMETHQRESVEVTRIRPAKPKSHS